MSLPTALSHPCYHDDEAARVAFESVRWPNGPYCPHCGAFDTVAPLGGESMGPGWYWCNKCREKFTIRVGSVLERSHIAMHKWLLAIRLLTGSKKGMSAHQLHRMLGVTYRSAWFMAHRIRLAMDDSAPSALGGEGKFVEADETYVGGKARNRKGKTPKKEAVFSLVERGGKSRSFHVANVTAQTLRPIIVSAASTDSHFRTDESGVYCQLARNSKLIGLSFMPLRNTSEAMRTRIRRRDISQSSSAASMASITMFPRRTCIVISLSSTSAIPIA
jgi:transposase-like protein